MKPVINNEKIRVTQNSGIFIVLRYLQKINFLKSRMTLGPNETLQSSGLLTSLIWEIIMLIPHPTPLLMGE
jgi:hypothetical protein